VVSLRSITAVYVNAVGFHAATLQQDASRLAALTELLTQTVCDAASEEKGVVDSFHGDRFLLSFNAASSCATHALRGARCALRIGQRLDASAPVLRRAGWPVLRITAGAASGPARCGTLGCQSARRFTMMGAPVPQAATLEQLCRRHPREQHWRMPASVSGRGDAAPYRVLVSQSMLDDIQTQLTVECVDVVRLPVATSAALMASRGQQRRATHRRRRGVAASGRAQPEGGRRVDVRAGVGRERKRQSERRRSGSSLV
jgi:class 3 adenylate cyclase